MTYCHSLLKWQKRPSSWSRIFKNLAKTLVIFGTQYFLPILSFGHVESLQRGESIETMITRHLHLVTWWHNYLICFNFCSLITVFTTYQTFSISRLSLKRDVTLKEGNLGGSAGLHRCLSSRVSIETGDVGCLIYGSGYITESLQGLYGDIWIHELVYADFWEEGNVLLANPRFHFWAVPA